jgi:hypothetical protein
MSSSSSSLYRALSLEVKPTIRGHLASTALLDEQAQMRRVHLAPVNSLESIGILQLTIADMPDEGLFQSK